MCPNWAMGGLPQGPWLQVEQQSAVEEREGEVWGAEKWLATEHRRSAVRSLVKSG